MLDKLTALCAPYVSKLELNGMVGRQMVFPTRSRKHQRKILFVYGIHGSMERFYGVVYFLARYGTVVMPDLPGFGGMETFYKVGKKPSLDAYADYMADYVKREFSDEKIVITGLSYGFVVVTRMLQRHPELVANVETLLSVVGVADGDDFAFTPRLRKILMVLFWLFRHQPFSWLASHIFLRGPILRLGYKPSHPKMQALATEDRPGFIDFEEHLWQINDLKTYGVAMKELVTFHHPAGVIPLTVHHVGTPHDHWLNDEHVRAALSKHYKQLVYHESSLSNHGGTAYDDETEAKDMVPASLVQVLDS